MAKVDKNLLNEELVHYLEEDRVLGNILRHPLVFHVPIFSGMENIANKQLDYKKKMVESRLKEEDVRSVIALYERPYRLEAFLTYKSLLDPMDYWPTLAWIWVDSENIPQNWNTWLDLLREDSEDRYHFMSEEDWAEFDALPERFLVYQGINSMLGQSHQECGSEEISWSLSPEVAEFFANRFGGCGHIISKIITKNEVFALLTSRGEDEILILPGTNPAIKLRK